MESAIVQQLDINLECNDCMIQKINKLWKEPIERLLFIFFTSPVKHPTI